MTIDRTLKYLVANNDVALADLPDWVRSNGEVFAAASRDIDLSDAPSSAITVDEYNRQVRDFYIVELVEEDGVITDAIVETVPAVSQFWTYNQQEFQANPLFSREYPPG
jgi:branched-chain amino acid transport system substrate-binding protein